MLVAGCVCVCACVFVCLCVPAWVTVIRTVTLTHHPDVQVPRDQPYHALDMVNRYLHNLPFN